MWFKLKESWQIKCFVKYSAVLKVHNITPPLWEGIAFIFRRILSSIMQIFHRSQCVDNMHAAALYEVLFVASFARTWTCVKCLKSLYTVAVVGKTCGLIWQPGRSVMWFCCEGMNVSCSLSCEEMNAVGYPIWRNYSLILTAFCNFCGNFKTGHMEYEYWDVLDEFFYLWIW